MGGSEPASDRQPDGPPPRRMPVRPRELADSRLRATPRGAVARALADPPDRGADDPSIRAAREARESGVRPPRFGAWTLDARCRVHRFAPFAHGDAPDHLHPATRAVAALAARNAIDHDRPRARGAAIPLAALVAAVATGTVAAILAAKGALPSDRRDFLMLAGLLASIALVRPLRTHLAFRHRGFAVAVPLLVLGRCGACGHPLHGSLAIAPVPADRDEGPRCACAECCAVWPHQAAGAPRDDDGRTRTDFPTVTGVDAWRLRRILARAMRAGPSDFRLDDRARPVHIAAFGVDSHGLAAAIAGELANAVRIVAVVFVALFFSGCPLTVIANIVVGSVVGSARTPAPGDAFVATGLVVLCGSILLLAILGAVDRGLRGLVAAELVARRLRKGRCPVCTKELGPREGERKLAECRCCGAAWR